MTNMVTMRHWKMPSRPVIWIQTAQRSMMMDATMMDLSICVQNWSCPSTPQSRACIQNKTENLTEDAYLRQVIPSKIYNICLLYVWILIKNEMYILSLLWNLRLNIFLISIKRKLSRWLRISGRRCKRCSIRHQRTIRHAVQSFQLHRWLCQNMWWA